MDTIGFLNSIELLTQMGTRHRRARAGVVMKTEPDEVIFEGMLKDVIFDKDIILTDKSDSPIIIINKEAAFKQILNFKIVGDMEMKKMLAYEL